MKDSVIFARDNFLKPVDLIFPSEATIYVSPTTFPNHFEDWDDVDGIKLSSFAALLRQQKSTKPEIMLMPPDNLLHSGKAMFWINLNDINRNDLDHIVFEDIIPAQSSGKHQAFCIWFDCRFPGESYETAVILSTGPKSLPTHWKQCVIVLPDILCEEIETNEPIAFKISMKRRENDNRKYDIDVDLLDPNLVDHPVPCNCYFTKCILIKAHIQSMDT